MTANVEFDDDHLDEVTGSKSTLTLTTPANKASAITAHLMGKASAYDDLLLRWSSYIDKEKTCLAAQIYISQSLSFHNTESIKNKEIVRISMVKKSPDWEKISGVYYGQERDECPLPKVIGSR